MNGYRTIPPGPPKEEFYPDFKPATDHLITTSLVGLNIFFFILMVASGVNAFEPNSQSIIDWGGNFRPLTLDGQWWRLLTCCFIHVGFLHLLVNLYGLFAVGLLLEPSLGNAKFAAAYVLTGVTSSVASLWWHHNSVSAGASGAILGIYGVFFALLTTNQLKMANKKALLIGIAVYIALCLAYGMEGSIDNAGHVGGICSGILLGYSYYPAMKEPGNKRLQFWSLALPAVTIALLAFAVMVSTPAR